MRIYKTESIIPDRRYTPSTAEKEVNVPRATIYRWIGDARLVCIGSTNRTMFTGQRLLEAIENRSFN